MEYICGHLLRATGEPCARPVGHELPHRPAARTAQQEDPSQPRRRTARDIAYGHQLGVGQEEALPTAIGATTATVRTPRRSRPKFGKVQTRFVDPKPAEMKKPTATQAGAEEPETCAGCGKPYAKGAQLARS
ncbi:hypothetical protein L3Q67_38815 [Saccharothrix sp. AJ9571]|nr:hypothetical protein L3Q67_38815 [Saccharothrix sp. AJ9571]